MLVIRRRSGESLLIGDQIEIEVLDIEGTQVKLGIRAPREVPVFRKEIRLTIDENLAASVLSDRDLNKWIQSFQVKGPA